MENCQGVVIGKCEITIDKSRKHMRNDKKVKVDWGVDIRKYRVTMRKKINKV